LYFQDVSPFFALIGKPESELFVTQIKNFAFKKNKCQKKIRWIT